MTFLNLCNKLLGEDMIDFVGSDIHSKRHIENLTKLKKILLINSVLDLGYIAIGIIIFIGIFNINEYNGHGIGVIIQGSFLAIFDTYYAVKIKAKGF